MEHKPLEKYKLELKELNKENSGLFIKINCPSCETEVHAANLHLNDKIGKCGNCNAVFAFSQEITNLLDAEVKKEPLSRPAGIEMIHFKNEIDFTLNQPTPFIDYFGLFFFSLFGFVATLIYFTKGIPFLIPVGLWLGSTYNMYNIITQSKNKIYLNIDQQNLTVKWRPKKRTKDIVIDVHDIDQVYLKTNTADYRLCLILNDIDGQKHVPLIRGAGFSLAQARYLEQEIEKHLGIKNRKVPESNVNV